MFDLCTVCEQGKMKPKSTMAKDMSQHPLTILREAVINAVVHADYAQKGFVHPEKRWHFN